MIIYCELLKKTAKIVGADKCSLAKLSGSFLTTNPLDRLASIKAKFFYGWIMRAHR